MTDWGASYEEQVRAESGYSDVDCELLSKTENLNLSKNGEGDGNRSTVLGPPPQTSFGAARGGFSAPGRGGFRGRGAFTGAGGGGFQQGFSPRGGGFSSRGGELSPRGGGFSARGGSAVHSPSFGSGSYQGANTSFGSPSPFVNPHPNTKYVSPTYAAASNQRSSFSRAADSNDDNVEKPMSAEEISLLNKFLHKTVKMMQDGTVDISKQQMDERSPLHSVLSFRDLRVKDELLRALDHMGFHQPSKIQEFVLPLLLMEPPTNIIAQSQSGTGKTASFVLTMLSRTVAENKWPQCLCLAPTYELAIQIGEVVTRMSKYMPDVKVHLAVKGVRPERGTNLTEQIIIGTPGKLIDHVTKMRCFDLSKIICLVLDEADVMISQHGHLDLSHRIYNAIEKASPDVQALLFSATYDDPVIDFAEKLIKDAVSVTLKREDQALPNIKQYYVECGNREMKYQAVCDLYSGLIIASSMIFTHTRSSATWLANRMMEKGHEVVLLHGEMPVEQRASVIEQFKDGVYKVLITTNVCARGIDASQVSIVINYDPPMLFDRPEPDYDTYIHRIGRTGRFGKDGIAINLVDSHEALAVIKMIEKHFGKPIPKLDPSDIDQLEAIEKE